MSKHLKGIRSTFVSTKRLRVHVLTVEDDASIIFDSSNERWRVILGGKNLTDEQYRTHAFDLSAFPGVELGYYNPPRTYRLFVSYQF